jgi:hypothetical protein
MRLVFVLPLVPKKKNDACIRQWLLVIEDYLCTAPNHDYIRLASSYLKNGPRSLSRESGYEAYKGAHARAGPSQPRHFF